MNPFEMVVIIVALSIGAGIITSFFKLIKHYVDKKYSSGNDLMNNEEFLAALKEFKTKTDKRLDSLESALKTNHSKTEAKKVEKSNSNVIELDAEDDRKSAGSGKLRNILKE
jgi:hypothetical protein